MAQPVTLAIDLAQLSALTNSLRLVADEFRDAPDRVEASDEVLGFPPIVEGYQQFVDNWSTTRKDASEHIDSLVTIADGAYQMYLQTEAAISGGWQSEKGGACAAPGADPFANLSPEVAAASSELSDIMSSNLSSADKKAAIRSWYSKHGDHADEVIAAAADRLGNSPDVPIEIRSKANLVRMATEERRLQIQLIELEKQGQQDSDHYKALDKRRSALATLASQVDYNSEGSESSQMWVTWFDPKSDGRLQVAIGDVESAENVVIVDPGTGGGLSSAPADLDRAQDLQRRSNNQTATVLNITYDAPAWWEEGTAVSEKVRELTNVGRGEATRSAAEENLKALRSLGLTESQNVSLVGHSWAGGVVVESASMMPDVIDRAIVVNGVGGSEAATQKAQAAGVDLISMSHPLDPAILLTKFGQDRQAAVNEDVISGTTLFSRPPNSTGGGLDVVHQTMPSDDPRFDHHTYSHPSINIATNHGGIFGQDEFLDDLGKITGSEFDD